jgi:predicted RNA methylase
MYAEFEVHRTMIRDRVRTGAFRRAINVVVGPGDIVLDVGAGSGILSVFAARAGAARVYAVERTPIAALAEQLAAANEVADTVTVIHGDVMDIELPEQVDVIVSEWLGGFGIDEGMLAPVIAARDRWLKAGGVMIPHSVMAWAALVHDRDLADTIEFLREDPFGLKLEVLVEMTVNEIIYSGTFRHLAADDRRSEPVGCGQRTRTGSRSSRRRRLTKPRYCCQFTTTERPTRSRSGSAPSSRPVSRSPWDPAIHRRTGG